MSKMVFPVITGFEENLPYYCAGVGIQYEQEDITRPHGHAEFQWIQCKSGKGVLYIGDEKYTLSPSQGMLLFPDEPHAYHGVDGIMEVEWIIFHGSAVARFIKETMKLASSGVFYISEPSRISCKLEELYLCALNGSSSAYALTRLTYDILLDIMELTAKSESSALYDKFKKIKPVTDYISKNYAAPITLGAMAQIAQMTPQHLCAIFKKYTSLTLFEYINMTRIQASKELLRGGGDMLIRDIALRCGFNDESYFCALFRRYEKMSPLTFKNTL